MAHEQAVIERDRRCVGCGYNLRGMSLAGACPECGLTIESSRRRLDDPLSAMPVPVVRAFRRGAIAATAVMILFIGLVVGRSLWPWSGQVQSMLLLACAAAWGPAVWLLTPAFDLPQASWHGFSDRGVLRVIARWAQLAWIMWAGLGLILVAPAGLSAGFQAACAAGVMAALWIGVGGLVCLAVVLRRLAEWVRDDTAAAGFNWFAWASVPALALSMAPLPGLIDLLARLFLIGTISTLPLALVSLTRSMYYSVLHAEDVEDVEARRRERAEADARRAAEAIARMDQARGGR